MFHEIRALKFVIPLIGTLFFVAACSSSGGGAANEEGATRDLLRNFFQTPSALNEDEGDVAAENIVLQTALAAAAAPVGAGTTSGVAQSTEPGLVNAPNLVVGEDSDGARTISFQIAGTTPYTIDTTVNAAGAFTDTTTGMADNRNLVQGGSGNRVTFTQTLGTADTDGNIATPTGELHVYLRTDTPNSVEGDDDYLAYGFWIYDLVGTDVGTDDVSTIGAFVDASPGVVFDSSTLAALTETATYEGRAEGLYHEEVGGTSSFRAFTAMSLLTADFGDDATGLGTITGTIGSFVGLPPDLETLEVVLGGTDNILTPNEGLFTGATTTILRLDDSDLGLTGMWGGKFYDDTDDTSTTDHPGTVAGTFGAASAVPDTSAGAASDAMNRRALLGIYWADLQPPVAP